MEMIIYFFTKQAILVRRSLVLCLPLQLEVPDLESVKSLTTIYMCWPPIMAQSMHTMIKVFANTISLRICLFFNPMAKICNAFLLVQMPL
jgi:hypothetical protein